MSTGSTMSTQDERPESVVRPELRRPKRADALRNYEKLVAEAAATHSGKGAVRIPGGHRPSRRGRDRHAVPPLPDPAGAVRSGLRRGSRGDVSGRRLEDAGVGLAGSGCTGSAATPRRSGRSPRSCSTASAATPVLPRLPHGDHGHRRGPLFERAQEAGVIRADVEIMDVLSAWSAASRRSRSPTRRRSSACSRGRARRAALHGDQPPSGSSATSRSA